LIELMVVVSIIVLVGSMLAPSLLRARQITLRVMCGSNIRGLAESNMIYAQSNDEYYVLAAADIFKDLGDGRGGHYRWHGSRDAANQPFDPARGPLVSYIGNGGKLKVCPSFDTSVIPPGYDFEAGCGGYGYNEQYIGGRCDLYGYGPQAAANSARVSNVTQTSQTVMFTDAGMAQAAGTGSVIVEYSFCEAPFWQMSPGPPSTSPTWPSIHFRHLNTTCVAWVDEHVTYERLSFSNDSYNLIANQVQTLGLGWFGPQSNDWFDLK
jgi:hypothetical protein